MMIVLHTTVVKCVAAANRSCFASSSSRIFVVTHLASHITVAYLYTALSCIVLIINSLCAFNPLLINIFIIIVSVLPRRLTLIISTLILFFLNLYLEQQLNIVGKLDIIIIKIRRAKWQRHSRILFYVSQFVRSVHRYRHNSSCIMYHHWIVFILLYPSVIVFNKWEQSFIQ